MAPRWTTKLFAIQCVKQLMTACKDVPHHVDLTKARQKLKVQFFFLRALTRSAKLAFLEARIIWSCRVYLRMLKANNLLFVQHFFG